MFARIREAAVTAWVAAGLVLSSAGCIPDRPTDPTTGMSRFDPVWISASWTGAGSSAPDERIDHQPSLFRGALCPSRSVILNNAAGHVVLQNVCVAAVSYRVCATSGSSVPASGALPYCAADPRVTPGADLTTLDLQPGDSIQIPSSANASVELFYCSTGTFISAPPTTDSIACIPVQ